MTSPRTDLPHVVPPRTGYRRGALERKGYVRAGSDPSVLRDLWFRAGVGFALAALVASIVFAALVVTRKHGSFQKSHVVLPAPPSAMGASPDEAPATNLADPTALQLPSPTILIVPEPDVPERGAPLAREPSPAPARKERGKAKPASSDPHLKNRF